MYVGLVQRKTLQALQGPAINEIPNIPQSTLPPCPVYQTLLFDFFEGLAPRLGIPSLVPRPAESLGTRLGHTQLVLNFYTVHIVMVQD